MGLRTPVAKTTTSMEFASDPHALIPWDKNEGSAVAQQIHICGTLGIYSLTVIVVHLNYKDYYIDRLEEQIAKNATKPDMADALAANESKYVGAAPSDKWPANNSRYSQLRHIYQWAKMEKQKDNSMAFLITGDFNAPSHLDYSRVANVSKWWLWFE